MSNNNKTAERGKKFDFNSLSDRTTCAELVFGSISGMYG